MVISICPSITKALTAYGWECFSRKTDLSPTTNIGSGKPSFLSASTRVGLSTVSRRQAPLPRGPSEAGRRPAPPGDAGTCQITLLSLDDIVRVGEEAEFVVRESADDLAPDQAHACGYCPMCTDDFLDGKRSLDVGRARHAVGDDR